MKKFVIIALAVVMTASFCACRTLFGPVYPVDRGEGLWTTEDRSVAVVTTAKTPESAVCIVRDGDKEIFYRLDMGRSFFNAYLNDGDGSKPAFSGKHYEDPPSAGTFRLEILSKDENVALELKTYTFYFQK